MMLRTNPWLLLLGAWALFLGLLLGVFLLDASYRTPQGPRLVGGIGGALYWSLQGVAALVAVLFLGLWWGRATRRVATRVAVVIGHVLLLTGVWLVACLLYSLYVGEFF